MTGAWKWVGGGAVMAGVVVGLATWAAGEGSATAPGGEGKGPPVTMAGRAEVMGLPAAPTVPATVEDLKLIQARVEAVVKEAVPATVAILLDGAQGSGVIVSKDGYVLTAGHVSGTPGTAIRIMLSDGREVKAKSLGANNGIDSGMVKITDPLPGGKWEYPFVPVGTAKKLTAGQWVVAIGHPGGWNRGRPPVVRLGRVLLSNSRYIGTDSPLISGDSGGPVFDLDGKLIGINSRIGPGTAANIHVPIDTFTETWDRLAKGEEWGGGHGWFGGEGPGSGKAALGITGLADEKGVRVSGVHNWSSAAGKGGLVEGDVITKFNGRTVRTPEDLATFVGKRKPGDTVSLQVLREEKMVDVTVKLAAGG